jgi:peptidoglycan/xylan/chitin deacetylase (PgdA/CDA1 family)
MLYLRARWYSSKDGIFLSRDPIESEPPYQYVQGNPIRYTDPSGFVYVTFDDGPHANDTKILDILRSKNAHANFFFHGERINLNDPSMVEIVWRVAAEGHRLGNHGYKQVELPTLCPDQVTQSLIDTEHNIRAALRRIKIGQSYRYRSLSPDRRDYIDRVISNGTGLFRPHGGDITWGQVKALECQPIVDCDEIGCIATALSCEAGPWDVVLWTVDPHDWEKDLDTEIFIHSPAEILERIQSGWYSGIGYLIREIKSSRYGSRGVRSNSDNILLHSDSDPTVMALERILRWLRGEGYTFDLLNPAWPGEGR